MNKPIIALLVFATVVFPFAVFGTTTTPSSETTLTWDPPTTNTDGTPYTDGAGYKIYYGLSSTTLSNIIDTHSTATTYVFANGVLPSGTWYFGVTAYDTSGIESGMSNIVSKRIDVVGPNPPVLKAPTGVVYI